MPFGFVLPRMAERPQGSVGLSLNPKDYDQRDLRALGFEFSSDQLSEEHRFELGGWSVSTRVSVIRITTMKLAGIGLTAALCAVNPNTGKYTAGSCALCAAVNAVACYHYMMIWRIRKQVFGGAKYARLAAEVGGEEEQLVGGRQTREKAAIFFQENQVDWIRHSDWIVSLILPFEPARLLAFSPCTLCYVLSSDASGSRVFSFFGSQCTLVLLSLDLGLIREYMHIASAGKIPLPPISKEWAALFQAAMMGFAMIYRFWCNEARSVYDPATKTYSPARVSTQILAFGSFCVACLFFVFALMGAIGNLPSTDVVSEPSLKSDIICLQLLTFIWIGYPLVSIAARIGHISVPGDEYSATWSFIKDSSYALLDVASKGGLAAVVVLKAFWISSADEAALVEAGKLALAALNATVNATGV